MNGCKNYIAGDYEKARKEQKKLQMIKIWARKIHKCRYRARGLRQTIRASFPFLETEDARFRVPKGHFQNGPHLVPLPTTLPILCRLCRAKMAAPKHAPKAPGESHTEIRTVTSPTSSYVYVTSPARRFNVYVFGRTHAVRLVSSSQSVTEKSNTSTIGTWYK